MDTSLNNTDYIGKIAELHTLADDFYGQNYFERLKKYNSIKEISYQLGRNIFKDFILDNILIAPENELKKLFGSFNGSVINSIENSNIPAKIYQLDERGWRFFLEKSGHTNSYHKASWQKPDSKDSITGIIPAEDIFTKDYKHLAGLIVLADKNSYSEITHEHEINHALHYHHPLKIHLDIQHNRYNNNTGTNTDREDALLQIYRFSFMYELSAILYTFRVYNIDEINNTTFFEEYMNNIRPLFIQCLTELESINLREANIIPFRYRELYEYRFLFKYLDEAVSAIAKEIGKKNSLSYAFLFAGKAMQILTYGEIKKDLVKFCLDYLYPNSRYFNQDF